MIITSSAFTNNSPIPDEFTCNGSDINPPLSIGGIPEDAQSLVLIIEDPDAPIGTWDHWLIYNIDPTLTEISPDSVPINGIEVINSFGKVNYGGPCPPVGQNHHYYFKIYALSAMLDSALIMDKPSLMETMKPYILASAELIGTYSR